MIEEDNQIEGPEYAAIEAIRRQPRDIDYIEACNANLLVVPLEILEFRNLRSLHLDSNRLESLPEGLFAALPSLDYLDLRFNQLFNIPSSIGTHRNLRTLLLQSNRIAALPVELGQVRTLSGLSMSENPLYFPSAEVVEQGVQALLLWLRERDGTMPTIESDNTFFTAEAVVVAPQLPSTAEVAFAIERAAISPPPMPVLPPIDPNSAPANVQPTLIPTKPPQPQPQPPAPAPAPAPPPAYTAPTEDLSFGDMKIDVPDNDEDDEDEDEDDEEDEDEGHGPIRNVASNFEPAPRAEARDAGKGDKYDQLLQDKKMRSYKPPKTPTGPLTPL